MIRNLVLYPEIIRACREVGERMYEERYGTAE